MAFLERADAVLARVGEGGGAEMRVSVFTLRWREEEWGVWVRGVWVRGVTVVDVGDGGIGEDGES